MAGSPQWKVYTADKQYVAACKDVEDAAAVVALRGDGATIRWQHSLVVWTEGALADGEAGESYDHVAEVAWTRVNAYQAKQHAKSYGTVRS